MKTLTKTFLSSFLLLTLLSPSPVPAQTSVSTDPVGFTTLNIAGGTLSLLGLNMLKPVELQGTLNVDSGNRAVVFPQNIDLTANQFGAGFHFLEIINTGSSVDAGNADGLVASIVSEDDTGDSLTLEEPLDAGVPDGAAFRIRSHWTLAEVFGDGADVVISKGSSSSADKVTLLNASGGVDTFFFLKGIFGDIGWVKTDDPTDGTAPDRGNTILNFLDGIIVQRTSTAPIEVKLLGTVKLNTSVVPINTGLNLVSTVYPVSTITLGNSGLDNFLRKGTDSSADLVLIVGPDGTINTYFFLKSLFGDVGWFNIDNPTGSGPSSENVPLPSGSSYVVLRKGGPVGVALNPPTL